MKVLMVSHYFDSHPGGIERVAGNLFRGLARPGCEILWAAADASAVPEHTAYQSVLPLPTWNLLERICGVPLPIPSISGLRRLCSAIKSADVLLLHDCLYISNVVACFFAHLRKIPVVVIQHIGIVPHRNPLLLALMAAGNRLLVRPMLASAQQVIFISQITKRYFGSVRFQKPAITIYNGVDCEIFRPAYGENKAKVREGLGLPCDKPIALFIGRFVEKKGLRILRELAARDSGITWAFAGAGPLDPTKWKFGNVHVYSSLRPPEIAALYSASDIFVLPSRGEGLPLVIQEALASGLPVVCSAETATADEALTPFVCGVELTDDDAESAISVLSAVNDLLNRTADVPSGQQRHAFARERYCWQHAISQYFEILSALVAHSSAATSDSSRFRNTAQTV
jgi:glycosyltransferase involved in cell wall biosynthesis